MERTANLRCVKRGAAAMVPRLNDHHPSLGGHGPCGQPEPACDRPRHHPGAITVEGLRVRERREVETRLKVQLDTLGIQHLNEAMEKARSQGDTPNAEEAATGLAAASYGQGPSEP